jgi:hypothetical protein
VYATTLPVPCVLYLVYRSVYYMRTANTAFTLHDSERQINFNADSSVHASCHGGGSFDHLCPPPHTKDLRPGCLCGKACMQETRAIDREAQETEWE